MRLGTRWSALLLYAGVTLAAVVATIGSAILAGRDADPALAWLLKCLLVLALVGSLTWVCMRRAGVGWRQFGVSRDARAGRMAVAGLACGLALAAAWGAIVWAWTPFALHANPTFTLRAFGLGTLATLAMGVAEEIGYRTWGLSLLEQSLGPFAAVLLPSLLFAAMHMTGGMPWLAALCVVASCGLLYGTLMLATRSLPFVVAFHVANNLLQDAILRLGDGSLFAPVFRAGPADATKRSLQIWLSMLVLNAALAALAWRWRTPPPVRGYAPATANPM